MEVNSREKNSLECTASDRETWLSETSTLQNELPSRMLNILLTGIFLSTIHLSEDCHTASNQQFDQQKVLRPVLIKHNTSCSYAHFYFMYTYTVIIFAPLPLSIILKTLLEWPSEFLTTKPQMRLTKFLDWCSQTSEADIKIEWSMFGQSLSK